MRIYLVGITGSGKSTLGKKLATSLKYSFLDLDDYLIKQEGKTIEAIFEQHGEEYFRKAENAAIKLIDADNVVISTGGGAPCFYDSMDIMLKKGNVVWINPEAAVVTERLWKAQNTSNRPLLKNKTKEEVFEFINNKIRERQPFYSKSKIIITHNDITVDMILNAISSEIN